jgi:hypothetical protein
MGSLGLTDADVQEVVDDPTTIEPSRGETVRYVKVVKGRPIRVVLAHDVDPPYVVTVMIIWFFGQGR